MVDRVALAVELLAHLEHDELPLSDVFDRIEAITVDPDEQRAILDRAEREGVIERDGSTVKPARGTYLRFERDVVSKDGEFSCRRCGASLSTGYFMRFESGDHGPFGSTCIRKVTGRD